MTTAATTQNCAMFHKRFSEILKTSLFKTLQNVVTFYQFEQRLYNSNNHAKTWSELYTDVQNCANYFVIVRIVKTLLELVEGYNVLYNIVQIV